MRIEQTLSKQRILELYLNEIYLGLGAYGVAAAAEAYFNKPLDKLTLPEAAFLAALPKAPNNYNPFKFADAAKARRDWVLDRMAEDHVITAAQAEAAKAEPIVPSEFRRPQPIPGADWFAEDVRRELIAQFGADVTTQGGLMVRTSLDPTSAGRRREGGARWADGLRPQAGRLARPGCASRWRRRHWRRTGPSRWGRWRGRRACCRTGSSPWCSRRPMARRGSAGSIGPAPDTAATHRRAAACPRSPGRGRSRTASPGRRLGASRT